MKLSLERAEVYSLMQVSNCISLVHRFREMHFYFTKLLNNTLYEIKQGKGKH